MKNSMLLSLVLFTVLQNSFGQSRGSIRGLLQDTASHTPITDATLTVLNAKDSSLVAFSRSGSNGHFLLKNLSDGIYRLLITHIGYRTLSRNFIIQETVRDFDIGEITLSPKSDLLAEVTVEQAPVTIRHDTVEFNAGSFKTKPDAVVEDLLKKLPGVQVSKDGTITANGEQVKKVLVDGKEFFGNDPKVASKNLPADAVDKVQVFDKKSDQSQFTGFDDGNSQKTINLTIKKDRKRGVFGKSVAGYGADAGRAIGEGNAQSIDDGQDRRYEASLNLNQLNNEHQLSVIGMANNTNKQGFSFQDVLGFNGGLSNLSGGSSPQGIFGSGIPIQGLTNNTQAITNTLAGGVNFNDSWNGSHTDIHGNYFYNHAGDQIGQIDTRQYLLPGKSYIQQQAVSAERRNDNHRFTVITDQQIDSLSSVKFTSSFIYQNSSSLSNTGDTSRDQLTSALLNTGINKTQAQMNGYTWNNNALLRHRFPKKGRTLSVNLQLGLNSSTGSGNLHSVNQFYQQSIPPIKDTLNQQYTLNAQGRNYGATVAYTEPLSKKSLLEFNYDFYQSRNSPHKKTYDADVTGKFTLPNADLSNDFTSAYTYHREGLRFRNQRPGLNFTIGANLQQAYLQNQFNYLHLDSTLHQSFFNVLPNANLQIDFNAYRNIRIFYDSYTNRPSVTQLAPVADNSDPLNITVGNPLLKQEFYHALRLNYIAFDPFRRTSFFAMLNYNGIHNRIVNDDQFDSSGVRTTKPLNFQGLFNANGYVAWGLPVRSIKSNLNLTSNVRFDHNASLVNGLRNTGNTWTISQAADLNFIYKEILDITGSFKIDYNNARYSLQPAQNQHYWTETYGVDFNWYLPVGLSIASNFDYIHRSGLPAGYNNSPFVWNAGLAKRVFKNRKGSIRLQVFDILKQNTGFSRNTSQNYIEDVSYNVLNRYWLLSFSYSISRFAGKSVKGFMQEKSDIKIIR